MTLTEQAKALYVRLNDRRRQLVMWRDSAAGMGMWPAVYEYTDELRRIDRAAGAALNRWFRREDAEVEARAIREAEDGAEAHREAMDAQHVAW